MQFTLAFVTLIAAVMAAPNQEIHNARAKRQAAQNSENGVTTQSAAMTNEAGDVIAFDSANVYLDSVAKGL